MVQVAGPPVGALRVPRSVDAAHAVDGNLLDEEFFDHGGGLVVGRVGVVTGVVGGDECVFLHEVSVSIRAAAAEDQLAPSRGSGRLTSPRPADERVRYLASSC